jgi:hypothetical protein
MRAAVAASIAVAVAAVVTLAQTQVRDGPLPQRGAVAPSGTGVLTGVLMADAAPPQPVRRATIRLSVQSGVGTRLAGTDDEGKFRFDALPAGTFTLSATKPGYVQTFHGSKHPGRGPGVPVAVADGQQVSVTLKIVPGAVITGTITDSRGNPAPNVQVAVVAVSAGGTSNTPVRGSTDDRGMYRVFGLAPGDYLVSALPPDLGTGVGYGRGQAPSILGVTDAEVKWARSQSAAGTAPMPTPGKTVTYAPVFHPGTTDVSAAVPVSVATGEERSGIGFALQVVPASRIAGTIIDAVGQPVTAATVALYPRRRDRPSPADALVSSGAVTLPRAVVSATGFSITGVAPGEYTMVARSGSGMRGAQPPPTTPVLWSVTDLTVDGNDQTDLVLRLMPGLKLSGSIVFEHTSLAPPADMSAIDLSLQASGSSLGTASTPRANVASNGTFTFSGIAPWIYTITATPPGAATGARWTLKSAVLNGRDLADSAFEVKPGTDVTGLAITFTDRAAEISGRLVDPGGRPITRYSIVVFPAERALWLPGSRRIRSARPATDGSFTVAGLPAGAYAIAAAEDVEAAELSDPAFLAQLLASAYKVTLADGEQKKQDLRAGG